MNFSVYIYPQYFVNILSIFLYKFVQTRPYRNLFGMVVDNLMNFKYKTYPRYRNIYPLVKTNPYHRYYIDNTSRAMIYCYDYTEENLQI